MGGRWNGLVRFLEDARIPLDNNATERALRGPVVGRKPTSIVSIAGFTTDPAVSVPTLAAQKLAAVPAPELEPPVLITGRPSLLFSRGSGRGSYGL